MSMKKWVYVVFLAAVLLFIGCESDEEADEEVDEEKEYNSQNYTVQMFNNLKELNEVVAWSTDPVGEQFWDVFGKFRHLYDLTDDENKLLGRWYTFIEGGEGPTRYFFPNKLFIGRVSTHTYAYKQRPEVVIDNMYGVWGIEDGKVMVTIYGYTKYNTKEDRDGHRGYDKCEPYRVEIININAVNPIGYTVAAFNYLPLPAELKPQVIRLKLRPLDRELKKAQYARHVVSYGGIDPDWRDYGAFNYFPAMALRKLSGEELVKSRDLMREVFKDFRRRIIIDISDYGGLSKQFPDDFPKLK